MDEAKEVIYVIGCFDKLQQEVRENQGLSIGIGVSVIALLIVGVILACRVGSKYESSDNYA